MNTKILSSLIFVALVVSVVLSGCGGGKKEEIYDIANPVIVNVGSKYLKLNISLGVDSKKSAEENIAKILDEINKTLGEIKEKPEELNQTYIAQKLETSLKNYGVKKVYFRAFVLQ